MAITKAFEDFARELFAGLGEVRTKRMFGAASLYCGEVLFAIADDEVIWIKVDQLSEPAFEAEGAPLFTYPAKDGSLLAMPYRRLPDAAFDDPDEALRWGRMGVEAALRKKAGSKVKNPRPAKT